MKLSRLFGTGLAGNLGAFGFAGIVQLVTQLAAVPAFSLAWGLERYGVWLLLFSVPAYLALADFGFVIAGANRMVGHIAQGRQDEAVVEYCAVRLVIGGVSAILLLGSLALLAFPDFPLLDFAQASSGGLASATLCTLGLYAVCGLYNSLQVGALRALGRYAEANWLLTAVLGAESLIAFATALCGGGFLAVAGAYLAVRLSGTFLLRHRVQHYGPWLTRHVPVIGEGRLVELAKPSLSAMLFPLGDALSLQGVVMALGMAAGPASLPAFTAARTLSRVPLRLVGMISNAVMPEFTEATARNDLRRREELLSFSVAGSLAILLPVSVGMLLLGPVFLRVWSGGVIEADWAMVALLVAAMALHAIWRSIGNLLLAMNLHGSFTPAFVVATTLCLPLTYWLALRWQGAGAALAVAIAEAIMVIILPFKARQAGILRQGWLQRSPAEFTAMVRRFID